MAAGRNTRRSAAPPPGPAAGARTGARRGAAIRPAGSAASRAAPARFRSEEPDPSASRLEGSPLENSGLESREPACPEPAGSAAACPDPAAADPAAAATADLTSRPRRAVLAAAASTALLAAAGCKGVGALAAPPRPAPEVALLHAAIAAEEKLIARYHAVITRSPGLAAGLRPLRAEHGRHLAELRSRLIVPPGSTAGAASSPAAARPPGPARGGGPAGPAGPAAAISFLQEAERTAAADLLRRLTAVSPSLAQLMASIAASEVTHVAALAAVRGGG